MGFIEKVIDEVKEALENKLYNIALISILTLPDIICQSVSNTKTDSKVYINWFDKYVKEYFRKDTQNNSFLNGNDCYSLRCSVLHQGSSNIKSQIKSKNLENFIIFASHDYERFRFHEFADDKKLRIQIEILYKNIVLGYSDWKCKLTPELLLKHNFYNELEINEISIDTINAFGEAFEKPKDNFSKNISVLT